MQFIKRNLFSIILVGLMVAGLWGLTLGAKRIPTKGEIIIIHGVEYEIEQDAVSIAGGEGYVLSIKEVRR